MTSIFKKILIPATALIALASCDNIDENERYVPVDRVEPQRVVLLEDFTGQTCNNCPDAHRIIELLQEQYPGSIVAVSIHGGGMALHKSTTRFDHNQVALGTDEGQTYNDAYGIDEWPSGVIDRRSGVLGRDKWAAYIDEELNRSSDVNIEVEARIEDNDIYIDLAVEPQADINGSLNVWILENGIVARQIDESGKYNRDYVHNHVFRACATAQNGDPIALTNGIHKAASYTVPLRYNDQERWNPANLSVVAFISDKNGVHQTVLTDVSTTENE